MGYTYPASVNADAAAVSAYIATRAATVTGTPTPPPAPGATDGFLVALVDAIMASLDYQGQSDAQASAANTNSGVFVDATGYPTWTVTVPVTKTYVLHVDLSCWMGTAADTVRFQIAVDGTGPSGQPIWAQRFLFNQTGVHTRLSWRQSLSLTAGSHTIKLQWLTLGPGFIQSDTNDWRCFTLTG